MNPDDKFKRRPNPPLPERDPGRGSMPFSILSAAFSGLFVLYGLLVISKYDTNPMLLAFGGYGVFYGLFGLAVLACAARYSSPWCIRAIQVVSAGCLIVYLLALSAGFLAGLEVSGILLLALALWSNWFAVTKQVRKREAQS